MLQSAALYHAPPAQQFAPQGEVPYAADAYQAVMGSAPLMQVLLSDVHHTAYASMTHSSASSCAN